MVRVHHRKRRQTRHRLRSDAIHPPELLDPPKRTVTHPVQDDRLGSHPADSRQCQEIAEGGPVEVDSNRDHDLLATPNTQHPGGEQAHTEHRGEQGTGLEQEPAAGRAQMRG